MNTVLWEKTAIPWSTAVAIVTNGILCNQEKLSHKKESLGKRENTYCFFRKYLRQLHILFHFIYYVKGIDRIRTVTNSAKYSKLLLFAKRSHKTFIIYLYSVWEKQAPKVYEFRIFYSYCIKFSIFYELIIAKTYLMIIISLFFNSVLFNRLVYFIKWNFLIKKGLC